MSATSARHRPSIRILFPFLITLLAAWLTPAAARAGTNYYVDPGGVSTNDGSQSRPLDLATALSGSSPARPGDTIWLRGGTYRGAFTSVLNGTASAPIVVRQYPGERATLDSASSSSTTAVLTVKGSYTWFWGFEVMNSYTNRASGASSRGPGVAQFGPYTKLINLVVHDALDGIETWSGVTDGEVYGNVIYNNGADGSSGAGHSMYVQNSTGTKRLVDNVMLNSYSFGIHVYTENGTINNVYMEGNISYNHGVLSLSSGAKANYLVGGSQVAQNPQMFNNYGYYAWNSQGRDIDLGWGTACNGLVMQGNYMAGGTSAKINCTNSSVAGNQFYGSVSSSVTSAYPGNTFSTSQPSGVVTIVRPNQYEPGRANVAVYNWALQNSVSVDLSNAGLAAGQAFEIHDAQNFFGPPVVAGTYTGAPVTIPMTGLTPAAPIGAGIVPVSTEPEFGAFIVLPSNGSTSSTPPPTATLTASPATISAGQPSTLSWTTSSASSVSISPSVGTVTANGSVTVTPSQTTTYTLTATGSGGSTSRTATVTVTAAANGSGAATFVQTDTASQGTWLAKYGSEGYAVAGDATSYPGYARVTFANSANYTWASSTSDVRALQRASGSGRVAGTWYESAGAFTIDVDVTDGASHQLAMYLLDWDKNGRAETIQVTERATGAILAQRSASSFQNGTYVVWNVGGSIRITVTRNQGVNAVAAGLFFDPVGGAAPTPPPSTPPPTTPPPSGAAGTATFLNADTTTSGSWLGTYGSDGYSLAGDATSYPAYAQVSTTGASAWTWSASTSQTQALQRASGNGRIAATWYETTGSMTFDVTITDSASHRLAMYFLDWDVAGRSETIQVLDRATGAVLDQRTVSSFKNGTWIVWQVSGSVRFVFTRAQGVNAVVSGLFFGGAGTPPSGGDGGTTGTAGGTGSGSAAAAFVTTDTTTRGSWINVYGKDGFAIEGDATKNPAYAQVTFANAQQWTWAGSTFDARALQQSAGAGRIAATWYDTGGSFAIDVHANDTAAHKLALYLVDWDGLGRAETIQIFDAASGVLLDQRSASGFLNGEYLVWQVTGSVHIVVTHTQGGAAVVSGVFFN